MGVDVVTIACRHRLPVYKPLDFIRTIGNIYNAGIKVVYYNERFTKEPFYVTLMEQDIDNPSEHLIIEMPRCRYLTEATSERNTSINWHSEELGRQIKAEISSSHGYEITGFKDIYAINIYQELADIDASSYRWSDLTNYFDNDTDKESFSNLLEYRRLLALHTHLLGCSEVFYFPDQYLGEFILERSRSTYEDFSRFIKERNFYDEYIRLTRECRSLNNKELSIIVNIPDFLKNNRTPIFPPKQIDVLWDDFSDL